MSLTAPPAAPPAPGDAPSRLVEETFDDLAEAAWEWQFEDYWPFMEDWQDWYTTVAKPELEALQADVEANATIAQGAVLTLNAVPWASGVAFAQGAAVYSLINWQTYLRTTALGSGVLDPSIDTANYTKKILAVEGSGSTEPTSAVDIALTALSTRVQLVNMTVTGKSVAMPDATTLTTEGGPMRVVKNVGELQFALRDNAGTILGLLDPGMTAALICTNVASAAGAWSVFNLSNNGAPLSNLLQGATTVLNASASTYVQVVMVTPTKAVISYQAGGAGVAVVVDITGTTVVAGTPQTISASGQGIGVCRLTASRVLFAYRNPGTSFLGGVIADIAGTVMTLGTANANLNVSVTITSNEGPVLVPISATQALVVYAASGSTFLQAVVITVTGITIAAGTVKVVTATAATFIGNVVPLVAGTRFIASFYNASNACAVVIEVAGTTVTNGTPLTVGPSSQPTSSIAPISATKALMVCHSTAFGHQGVVLDVSGTTITLNQMRSIKPFITAAPALNPGLVALGNGKFVFSVKESNSGTLPQATMLTSMVLTVRGTEILVGPEISNAVVSLHPWLAVMSADKVLVAHSGTSSFLNAQVLEVAT